MTAKWKEFLQPTSPSGSFLNSAKVKQGFMRAVEVAVESVRFPDGWSLDSQYGIVDPSFYAIGNNPAQPTGITKAISVRQNGPAILLGLQYNENRWPGQTDDEAARAKRDHDSDFVSVDLTPCIRIPKRDEYFSVQRLVESRDDSRVSFLRHVIESDDIPLHIVCSKEHAGPTSHLWRMSCSCMEAALLQVRVFFSKQNGHGNGNFS